MFLGRNEMWPQAHRFCTGVGGENPARPAFGQKLIAHRDRRHVEGEKKTPTPRLVDEFGVTCLQFLEALEKIAAGFPHIFEQLFALVPNDREFWAECRPPEHDWYWPTW